MAKKLPNRQSNAGTDVPGLTPSARILLVQLAVTTQQLRVLANQLNANDPLRSALTGSIRALELLLSGGVTGSAPAAQPTIRGMPTVASLMARIASLHRLLTNLTRVDPSAARRLAPTLHLLHALLVALLRADRHDALARPIAPGLPTPPTLVPFQATAAVAFAPQSVEEPVADTNDASAALLPATVLRPATSGPASGSPPSTAPASGAVVTAAGHGLAHKLSSSRLALEFLPWQSALVAGRLERPG